MNVEDGSLLLYCLGIRGNGGGPDGATSASDWAEVVRQAGSNGVTPLLYHQLRTIASPPLLPPAALEHLRGIAVQSAAQSLQMTLELREVLEALRRRGISVIVLKGAHLGQLVYRSFALRTMCDVDVLVRRDDLAQAAAILGDLGLVPQYYDVELVDYARHHHLRPMARPGGVSVELHWTIAKPRSPFDIDLAGLWERAQPARIAGVEALVLSPEDLVLHLCLHVAFADQFRAGLRTLWDIREVSRHHRGALDWDVVVRRAQQWGIGRYVYLTLRLAHELLAAEIPGATLAALQPPGFTPEVVGWAKICVFTPEQNSSVSPSMAKLWTSRRLAAKLTVLRQTLYPSRMTMTRIYRVPAGSPRIYLYYLVRWADLLFRYGRHAWGLWRGDHRTQHELRAMSERAALGEWLGVPPLEESARSTRRA